MKRIIATVFLFIFISAFSLATFAEESYPVERYFVYVSEYVSPGVYQEVNVTTSVSRNGLTLTLPHISEPSTQIRIILTSLPASNSQAINKSVYSISGSVSLSWVINQSFLPQNFTGSVENQKFKSSLPNPQYPDAAVNYEVDGSVSISNNISFSIAPSSQLSARLVFYLDLGTWLSGAPVITFNNLYINNEDILDQVYVDEAVRDFEQSSGDVLSVISDFDAFENSAFDSMVNVTNDINNASSYVSDVATFLEDSYEAVSLYTGTFAVINNFSIISGFIVIVAVFMVVSYIIFGRAG